MSTRTARYVWAVTTTDLQAPMECFPLDTSSGVGELAIQLSASYLWRVARFDTSRLTLPTRARRDDCREHTVAQFRQGGTIPANMRAAPMSR